LLAQDILLEETERSLRALEELAKDQRIRVVQKGQELLAETVETFARAARENFAASRSETSDPDELRALSQLYQGLVRRIRERYIPCIGDPFGPITPPEITTAASAAVGRILDKFILTMGPSKKAFPETLIVSNVGAALVGNVEKWSAGVPPSLPHGECTLVALTYPEVQARNPLYFTLLLGHEVMHNLEAREGISEEVGKTVDLLPDEYRELVKHYTASPLLGWGAPIVPLGANLTEAELQSLLSELWHQTRDSWLMEIACDLLAVRYLGPSYLFSCAQQFLAAGIIEAHTYSHPHGRLRLEMMLKELRSMGYSWTQNKGRPALRYLASLSGSLKPPAQDSNEFLLQIAERGVRRGLPLLVQRVRSMKWPPSYEWRRYRGGTDPLLRLLKIGVPPAEIHLPKLAIRRAADTADVLNAAFEFQIAHLGHLYRLVGAESDEERLRAYWRFQDLILMALESIEVLRSWKQAREAEIGC